MPLDKEGQRMMKDYLDELIKGNVITIPREVNVFRSIYERAYNDGKQMQRIRENQQLEGLEIALALV